MAIGFGIIGCGMISRFHAKAVADIKGAKVTACFDSFTASADKFGAEIGCKVYHDLDKMLADPAVDIVTICTPSGVHMEPAVAAAKAGKHIIVEKPLEITTARVRQMTQECDAAGVTLGAIFPQRFNPVNVAVRDAAQQGRFGNLAVIHAAVPWWRDDDYYAPTRWQGKLALDGGGALMNQAIHTVDIMQWLAAATMPASSNKKTVPRAFFPLPAFAKATAGKPDSPHPTADEFLDTPDLRVSQETPGRSCASPSARPHTSPSSRARG